MLKVLIENQEIDFNGVISHRMLNPMLNDKMSHTYNCKTALTARTKDIINQLHLPETEYNQIRFNGKLITDAFTFSGAIYINSVIDEYLDFQFNAQNDFWNLANVKLGTLPLTWDAIYPPIKNSKLMDTFPISGDAFTGFANAIDETATPINDETTAPVPALKLNTIIEDIFNIFNLTINRNQLSEHPDVKRLYLLSSTSNGHYWYPLFDPSVTITFTVTIENGKYVFTSGYKHEINNNSYLLIETGYVRPIAAQEQLVGKVLKVTVDDEYKISFDVTPIVTVLNTGPTNTVVIKKPLYLGAYDTIARYFVPEINAGEFLKEVEKLTASRVFVDESTKECRILFLKDILKSSEVTDISEYAGVITQQPLTKQDGYKLSFENPSGDDFWSERVKEITDMLVVRDPVATRNNLPLLGNLNNDIRLVQDENAYYRYYEINFLRSKGWEFYSDNFLNMQSGAGSFSIQTKFSPVLNELVDDYYFLKVEKEGKFLCLNEKSTDDFRLFFYRDTMPRIKLVNGQWVTYQIPICVNDVYAAPGIPIPIGELSLRWDGQYGLYEQLYKEWIDLTVNHYREETIFVNWPHWMLNSFAWWKKYRINHQNHLVKSIDLELSTDAIKIKDTVLVPV